MKRSKLESGVEIEKHSTDQKSLPQTSRTPCSHPRVPPNPTHWLRGSVLPTAMHTTPLRSLITLLNYHPLLLLTPKLFPFPLPALPIFKSPRIFFSDTNSKESQTRRRKTGRRLCIADIFGSGLIWEGPQANAPCPGCTDRGCLGGCLGCVHMHRNL